MHDIPTPSHLVIHHGYERLYAKGLMPDVREAEHDRLHSDGTAEHLDHRHEHTVVGQDRTPTTITVARSRLTPSRLDVLKDHLAERHSVSETRLARTEFDPLLDLTRLHQDKHPAAEVWGDGHRHTPMLPLTAIEEQYPADEVRGDEHQVTPLRRGYLPPMPLSCTCEKTHVFVVSWLRSDGESVDLGVYSTFEARDAAASRLSESLVPVERHNVHLED